MERFRYFPSFVAYLHTLFFIFLTLFLKAWLPWILEEHFFCTCSFVHGTSALHWLFQRSVWGILPLNLARPLIFPEHFHSSNQYESTHPLTYFPYLAPIIFDETFIVVPIMSFMVYSINEQVKVTIAGTWISVVPTALLSWCKFWPKYSTVQCLYDDILDTVIVDPCMLCKQLEHFFLSTCVEALNSLLPQ